MRILDVTQFLAGPIAGCLLADLGAEVIHVEDPKGDRERAVSPDRFLAYNRNKTSITLNLRASEGRRIFLDLTAKSDIVIENFSPGTMAAWGLDYPSLSKINPYVIMVSISLFGQSGPNARKKGMDGMAQAITGLMSMTGFEDGFPLRTGIMAGDVLGGFFGAYGALAALMERNHSGKGQHVDVSMTDGLLFTMGGEITRYSRIGELPHRMGNRVPSDISDCYRTVDGFIYVTAWGEDIAKIAQFIRLDRQGQSDREWVELVHDGFASWIKKKTRLEVERFLTEKGIMNVPVKNIADVMADKHFVERQMFHGIKAGDATKVVGIPVKFSRTPCKVRSPPPNLAEGNKMIYGKLIGMKPRDLENLQRDGVI